MKSNKKILILLIVTMLMLSSMTALAAPGGNSSRAFDNRIVNRIDSKRMMENLEYMVDEIGVRVASSPEERTTAEFIANELQDYGYDNVDIKPFEYRNRVAYLEVLGSNGRRIDVRAGGNRNTSILTGPEGITGYIVDSGLGREGDFPAEVYGNIALVQRGTETFSNIVKRAEEVGATGVIIQNNSWQIFSVNVPEANIPYVAVNFDSGELLKGEEIRANLRIEEFYESWNVEATVKPKNKNKDTGNIIIISAHYDTVPTAPGASDNATGVVGLLELARIYSNFPIDTEIRFLAFGAEEVGLVGSRHYVNQLSNEEKSRVIANYNMDMIGTASEPQDTLFVNVLTGTAAEPQHNLVSFTALEAAKRLGYDAQIKSPFYRGASDHVPFAEAGIAAGNFIYRDPITIALEPWYHQPYDTLDKVSEDRLLMAVEIIAAATHDVVRFDTPNLINSKIRENVERPLDKNYDVLEPQNTINYNSLDI